MFLAIRLRIPTFPLCPRFLFLSYVTLVSIALARHPALVRAELAGLFASVYNILVVNIVAFERDTAMVLIDEDRPHRLYRQVGGGIVTLSSVIGIVSCSSG